MQPIQVTTQSFQSEVLNAQEPVVVDFWAPWCGPCRMVGPVLDDLARVHDGKVKVVKVNVDDHPELADRYQVRGIPTLVAVHKGKNVGQIVGFRGRGPLEELFTRLADIPRSPVS